MNKTYKNLKSCKKNKGNSAVNYIKKRGKILSKARFNELTSKEYWKTVKTFLFDKVIAFLKMSLVE